MKTNRQKKIQYNESKKKSKFRKDLISAHKQLEQSCNDPNFIITSPIGLEWLHRDNFDMDWATQSELVGGVGYLWGKDLYVSKAIGIEEETQKEVRTNGFHRFIINDIEKFRKDAETVDEYYREIGRKLLMVEELPQRALPLFDPGPQIPISEIKGRRYYIKD